MRKARFALYRSYGAPSIAPVDGEEQLNNCMVCLHRRPVQRGSPGAIRHSRVCAAGKQRPRKT
jgi:hypothetical protein